MITDDGFIRDSGGNDRPVRKISRNEYWLLGNKTNPSSEIVEFYYDQQLTNGELYVFNPTSDVTDSLELVCQLPIEDVDSANDNFDFPQDWLLPLQQHLALALAPSYGTSLEQFRMLRELAAENLEEVLGWDVEKVSIFIQPEHRGRW